MKATALIAAGAIAFAGAALAQTQDNTSRSENSASADSMKPADDAQRTKDAVKHLGQKTRNAMHRAGDRVRHVAKNDKDRHHDKHARADRHSDTRAMGAAGTTTRDADMSRRERMDEAYDHWKAGHKNG